MKAYGHETACIGASTKSTRDCGGFDSSGADTAGARRRTLARRRRSQLQLALQNGLFKSHVSNRVMSLKLGPANHFRPVFFPISSPSRE